MKIGDAGRSGRRIERSGEEMQKRQSHEIWPAVLAAVALSLAACEERPSADSSVDQETQPDDATTTGAIPPDQVETDRDPTPQTGTGGDIPETEEGSSR